MPPRDYKRPLAQPKSKPPLPAWAMLSAGVLLGLFIAFLVYLADLPPASDLGEVKLPKLGAEPAPEPAPKPAKPSEPAAPPKPRFEFYSILPELEVVVPEPEPLATPPTAGSPEAPRPAPAEVSPGQTYYLQAGSFRNTAEADRMKASLTLLGLDVVVQTVSVDGTRWHRVRVGPYRDSQSLNQARRRLHDNRIEYMTLKASGQG